MQQALELDRATTDPEERVTAVFALRHGTRANLRARADRGPTNATRAAWLQRIESLLDDVEQSSERCARVDGLRRAAWLYEQRLGDAASAFIVVQAALYEDPSRADVRDECERLATAIGAWDELAAGAEQVARELEPGAPRDACRLWVLAGGWHADPAARADAYRAALALRPADRAALAELAALHESEQRWEPAVALLARLADATDQTSRRVDLNHRIARILCGYLDDDARAETYLLRALALDPGHMASIEDLSEIYRARGDWRRAADALRRAESRTKQRSRRVRLLCAAGDVCRDSDPDAAAELYAAALALAPEHDRAVERLAELYWDAGRWEQLEPLLELQLRACDTDAGADADSDELGRVAELHHRLGRARAGLGRRRAALDSYAAALALDSGHRGALRGVADMQRALGDWRQVAASLRALTEGAGDDERAGLFDELVGVYRDHLDRPRHALVVCREGLAAYPDDRRLLQKLLELLIRSESWSEALAVLERFTALEPRARERGKYFETAAAICRDELGAPQRAVHYLERALDGYFDPSHRLSRDDRRACMKAFAEIDAILSARGAGAARERAYLRMIDRLEPGDPVLPRLLDALGELYRDCLGDPARAIAAFEAAAELDPEDGARRSILAQLHVAAGPCGTDKAIAQHTAVLARNPRDGASYRALRALYIATHQYDKAWCVCAALTYLDRATHDERRYCEMYRPRFVVKSREKLTGGIWHRVAHPGGDAGVAAILGAIATDVARMSARPHRDFGLDRKRRRDTDGDQLALSRVLDYAARVLDVTVPDLYLQPDDPGELLLANTGDRGRYAPSLVARAGALHGRSGRELAYLAGRTLALLRPEHLVWISLPDRDELRAVLAAAFALARGVPGGAAEPMLARLHAALTPADQGRLAAAVACLDREPASLDVAAWSHAVELTAHRVGFILAGDLAVAARGIARESAADRRALAGKVDELLLYSVSEDYFAVRRHLGTTIDEIERAARHAGVAP